MPAREVRKLDETERETKESPGWRNALRSCEGTLILRDTPDSAHCGEVRTQLRELPGGTPPKAQRPAVELFAEKPESMEGQAMSGL